MCAKMFVENEIKLYKRSLRGKSENTKESYSSDVSQFLTWVADNNFEFILEEAIDADEMTDILENYKDEMFSKYESIKTINRKYNSINSYLQFKKINYHIKGEKVQVQTFIDDMLSNEELKKVVDASLAENDLRTATLIYGLFYTGARISELLQLKVSHLGKDEVMVKGKGSKYRKLLIPPKLRESMIEYANTGRLNKDTDSLFTSTRGKLTRSTVNRDLKKYGEKVGLNIEEKLHPHIIRHLFTKNLISKGVSVSAVKQLLGHSLTTTDIYAQLSKKELMEVINGLEL